MSSEDDPVCTQAVSGGRPGFGLAGKEYEPGSDRGGIPATQPTVDRLSLQCAQHDNLQAGFNGHLSSTAASVVAAVNVLLSTHFLIKTVTCLTLYYAEPFYSVCCITIRT